MNITVTLDHARRRVFARAGGPVIPTDLRAPNKTHVPFGLSGFRAFGLSCFRAFALSQLLLRSRMRGPAVEA
jgi:hypothetical protein